MRCRVQCAVILIILFAARARAQVFRVQGGESTLLNAEGASVEFKAPQYDGSVGLGNADIFKTVDRVAKRCELNSTHSDTSF